MATSETISTDKAKFVRLKVTQENVIFIDGQEAGGKNHDTVLTGFLKLHPKALGTFQVMNGVMIFFLGILLTIHNYNYPAILAHSGITYWGSLIYISAGSLSFVAQNKLHPYVYLILRIVGIMLVFTIPQFIISICISAFACKATCNRDSTVVNVLLN
ncbi:membrane-spanning 4-domains subfamily A member 4D-like isoform X2 [Chanodichthys erythropterus]|uniref:membrane-spanning 4-domains subfamily A member 4D-like isoform X2 n=1 Tax=Chanodichthys erythropterus TaxID=933992 RepID=UPI00351F2934